MLHAVLLAALTMTADPASLPLPAPEPPPKKTATQMCLETMDGAVYHGDPSDRRAMRAALNACVRGTAEVHAVRLASPAQGPEKLFLTGRLLDRAATLAFMGLGDPATAMRDVRLADLYFRVAVGLPGQSAAYHEAAEQNATLTRIQLATLRAEIASAAKAPTAAKLTAYHKL